ncbi:hypothetical protein [Synechococcus sp. UW140]|uniref:hypothetical protein n=1 Tax=Synechococcus sp. UW140 TaxID=368503 RepID=UPI0025D003E2|nr:hypothetical protein [Synechococcus sp. UW140]
MQEFPDDASYVELSPLTLVKWIDTSPDLQYIREAADKLQGRYENESQSLSFQTPDRKIVSERKNNLKHKLREILWPSGASLRGKTSSSQEFDQSCSTTANLMAGSTLWDAISTFPILQYGTSAYLGILSTPAAIAMSAGLMFISNWSGQSSCNRTKGKKVNARQALIFFAMLSFGKTALAGVGMDILVNTSGITKDHATMLANDQIHKSQQQLKQLRRLENPKYVEYKQSCDTLKSQLATLPRDNPLFNTFYVKAYGEYREQQAMQGMNFQQKLGNFGGSIGNIPGDCNKQRLQAEIDGRAGDQLSIKLDKWRTEKEVQPPLKFLSQNFPDVFSERFRIVNNEVVIRDGGEMVSAAWSQFFTKLFDPSRIGELGFSLFWMFISTILSGGAIFFLRNKSKSEDMKMSYSNELLLEREKFLEGYTEALEDYQAKRRRSLAERENNSQRGDKS